MKFLDAFKPENWFRNPFGDSAETEARRETEKVNELQREEAQKAMEFEQASAREAMGFTQEEAQSLRDFNMDQSREQRTWSAQEALKTRKWSEEQASTSREWSAREAMKSRDYMEKLSGSSIQRMVVDAKKAGINPVYLAGSGGASTPSAGIPSTSIPSAGIPSGSSATGAMGTGHSARGQQAGMRNVIDSKVALQQQATNQLNALSGAVSTGFGVTKGIMALKDSLKQLSLDTTNSTLRNKYNRMRTNIETGTFGNIMNYINKTLSTFRGFGNVTYNPTVGNVNKK